MHTNNKHNDYSAAQLEEIIERIREQDGKVTCRQLGERIGRSTWTAWNMLRLHGLPTRLFIQSLMTLEMAIREGASSKTSVEELFQTHGSAWANVESFKTFLQKRGIAYQHGRTGRPVKLAEDMEDRDTTPISKRQGAANVQQLIEDATTKGYNTAALTLPELAEMYDLTVCQVRRALRLHKLPFERRKPGTAKGVKRGPRRAKCTRVFIGREGMLDDTKKTDVELHLEAQVRTGEIDNNPTKLYKPSFKRSKAAAQQ